MSNTNPFETPEQPVKSYTEGDEVNASASTNKKSAWRPSWSKTKTRLGLASNKKSDNGDASVSDGKGMTAKHSHSTPERSTYENVSPNNHTAAKPPASAQPSRPPAAPIVPQGPVFNPQATLPAFQQAVQAVKELLDNVELQKQDMMDLHETAKKLTKASDLQTAQQDMATLVKSIKGELYQADIKIKAIQKLNERDFMEQVNAVDVDATEEEIEQKRDTITSVFNMRAQVTISLVAKFDKTCTAFKTFEQQVSDEYHEAVKRRLHIINNEVVDDDRVDELIESGQAESLFKQAMLQNRGQAVAEFSAAVQERHEAMQKLVKDLLELQGMMQDFSTLVYEQGKRIDDIANQVSNTAEYIRRGTDQLLRAKAHKKTANKFKSAAALTVGGVAAAGAAMIGLTVAGIAAPLAM